MNLTEYPYPSTRKVVLGHKGAVATSQPLASVAGIEMLLAGGNAVDAALAMAIALTVVEPTSNGIGGDAFALVWDGRLHGLNASGMSPSALDYDTFASEGKVPVRGWLPVTVPGAPSAWRALSDRFGKLPFEQLFAPAIRYAEEGFPVSPETAGAWRRSANVYQSLEGKCFEPFKKVFFPLGRGPNTGEIWNSHPHARTLREIASTGAESFYSGNLANQMAQFAADTGGYLSLDDLKNHRSDWVEPISLKYRGLEVYQIPPSGQGIAALMALGILQGFDLGKFPRDSAESFHWQIEAMKLAFADAERHVADPRFMTVSTNTFLDETYLASRRKLVGEAAAVPETGIPKGGTVYLCAADGELMVSFIQSNYMGFGSGVLVDGTGIALQNRGSGFTLEARHPNQYAPAKRPFHTIIPGFLTQGGKPLGPFGVMGGHMQPQGHVQVVVNLADYEMNPQAALDAPRWQWIKGKEVQLESSVPEQVTTGLRERGHTIEASAARTFFGRGQMILRDGETLVAASETRADGLAIVL